MGKIQDRSVQRRSALSRWNDEGGAGPGGRPPDARAGKARAATACSPENTECARLRMRVIALENLVIALLAATVDAELGLARGMAIHISPRPGSTPHPLTLDAAAQMIHLVERAEHFRRLPVANP